MPVTHSLVIAVLDSHAMVAKQQRYLNRLLPENWELILVDDGSTPMLPFPEARRYESHRQPGEWTQKAALNYAIGVWTRGDWIVKLDIDHILTAEAILAAEECVQEMMLFHRKAGRLTDDLAIEPLDIPVTSPVDDIWLMRKSLFLALGGYPEPYTRRYGGAGKCFWEYSRRPESQPPDGALIYVTPAPLETYHNLPRVA